MNRLIAPLAALLLSLAATAGATEPTATLPELLGFDVQGGEVRLVWDTVPSATGYLVEVRQSDGTFKLVSDVAVSQPWMDIASTLRPDTRAVFRVVSISAGVKSAPSRPVSYFRKKTMVRYAMHPPGLMMAPAVDRRDQAPVAAAPVVPQHVVGVERPIGQIAPEQPAPPVLQHPAVVAPIVSVPPPPPPPAPVPAVAQTV